MSIMEMELRTYFIVTHQFSLSLSINIPITPEREIPMRQEKETERGLP